MDTLNPKKNESEIFNINLWSKWLKKQYDIFVNRESYHCDEEEK